VAVTLRSATTASTGASTALTTYTIANPSWSGSATPAGDIVLLYSIARGAVTFTTPTGFTAVTATSISSSQYQLFFLVTAGTEGATFTVTWSGANPSSSAAISYSAAVTSPVFDPSTPGASAVAGLGATGITTVNAGDQLVYFHASKTSTSGQTPGTLGPPTSFTSRVTPAQTTATTAPNVQAYIADMAQGSAGATGTITGTDTNVTIDTSSGSLVVALSPAAATGVIDRVNVITTRQAVKRASLW
jgi:hypothetical protein